MKCIISLYYFERFSKYEILCEFFIFTMSRKEICAPCLIVHFLIYAVYSNG